MRDPRPVARGAAQARRAFVTLLGTAAALPVLPARAQSYPAHPIRIIVPQPTGGPSDTLTRLVADGLRQRLGQAVIVENKPGAGGGIGLGSAARAAADGYTLAQVATFTYSVNPALYKNLPYQPERDFVPVAILSKTVNVLYVNSALPAKSLGELIAYAKANPGKLAAGYPGIGNSSQIILELLKKKAGLDILSVPFQGDSQALMALVNGDIHMMFAVSIAAAQLVKDGKLRAIAVVGSSRASNFPDVPTFPEAGFESPTNATNSFGIVTNAGVDTTTLELLNREINAIVDTPQFKAQLAKWGMSPGGGSLEEIRRYLATEQSSWKLAVADSGARVE